MAAPRILTSAKLLSPSNTRRRDLEMKVRVIAYDQFGVPFSVQAGRDSGISVDWTWFENDVPVTFLPRVRPLPYGTYPYRVISCSSGWERVRVAVKQRLKGVNQLVVVCARWSVPDNKTGQVPCE